MFARWLPRTLGQAQAPDAYLNSHAIPLDGVLELRVNEEILIQRLAGRGREDDDPAVIRKRFQMYRERTEPLLDYYAMRGFLATINGIGTTDEVFQRIQAAVDQFAVRTAQPSATNNPQPGPSQADILFSNYVYFASHEKNEILAQSQILARVGF